MMQSTFWKRTICSVLACSSLFYSLPLSSAADAETGASASETESTEPTEPPDDPVVSSTDTPAETTETATETILEEPDDDNISLGDLTGDGMIAVDDAVFVLTIYAKMAAGNTFSMPTGAKRKYIRVLPISRISLSQIREWFLLAERSLNRES